MRNLILLFLSYIILTTYAFSNSVSEYISNLIPGEGDTEVSIDLRENHSPDYSILLVREIDRNENSNYFTQMSLFNTEKNNDERITANFGLGKRFLSDDKFSLTGLNLFLENTAKTQLDIENEVDRYIAWPGQALAYKIGQLKIMELRDKAKESLGEDFDIKTFHDHILSFGSIPLNVLEEKVDEFIVENTK